MKQNQFLGKYQARLKKIGLLKSAIYALVFALSASFLAAFCVWFFVLPAWGLWLIIAGTGVLTFSAALPLLYFLRFRPTERKTAREVDRLGLEERTVTMLELENDDSFIARRQRDDAEKQLETVRETQLRLLVPKTTLLALALSFVFCAAMTSVSSLASLGAIKHGNEVFEEWMSPSTMEREREYVEITYLARANGRIEGEAEQRIEKGSDASPVRAIPDEGYAFLQWSDGVPTPERWDLNVEESFAVEAIFLQPTENGRGDKDSDKGEGKQPSEQENDGKGDKEDEDSEDPGDKEEGDGNESESDDNSDQDPDKPSLGAGTIGSGDNNSVIDGKTDYRTEFDYDESMNDVEGDDSIPSDLKDALSGYFDSLKP